MLIVLLNKKRPKNLIDELVSMLLAKAFPGKILE